jgi:hypothetical protein
MVLGVAVYFAGVAIVLAQQPLNAGANLQGNANGQIQNNQLPPAQGNVGAQGGANVQAGPAGAALQGGANLQGTGSPIQGGAQLQGGANSQIPGAVNLQGRPQANINGPVAPQTFQGQSPGTLPGQANQQAINTQGQARTTTGYRGVNNSTGRRGPIARLLARMRNY